MKKYIISLLTVIATACIMEKKESPLVSSSGQELTITASFGDTESRTGRAADGAVLWSPGDQISLFYGSGSEGGSKFISQNTEPAKVVNFSGAIGVVTGGNDIAPEDTYFWATYPYNASASCDGKSITTGLSSEQLATADTFADNLFPSIGRSQGLTMGFYNICGGLKITISEEGIKSVTLQGHNHEVLAGTITVGLNADGLPVVNDITDGSETITVSAPEGETFEVGKSYYIILVPTVFENGFTLTFSKGYARAVYDRTKATTIRRSVFGGLMNPDANLEWEESLDVNSVPPDNEIWYITSNHKLINLEYTSKPFDSNVISHTYENNKGIIRCDAAIKIINNHVFGNGRFRNITHLFLPNSITELKTGALSGITIEELRIPDNLQCVGAYALRSSSIRRFVGLHTSADGRCVIIEDGYMPNYGNTRTPVKNYMAAFAPSGLTEYTIPSSVEIIGWYVFYENHELKILHFNEGLKSIMGDCFADCNLDCEIVLPSTLVNLDSYAFRGCTGIKGFYGNEKFHTSDHMCLTTQNGTYLVKFVGTDLTDYSIPEGITGIENYTFQNMTNLRSVTFPASMKRVPSCAFYQCNNLEVLYGECVSDDHKGIVVGTCYQSFIARKGITKYIVPYGIESIGYNAFEDANELEEIIIPDSVTELGGYDFHSCRNLKKIVLSSKLERVKSYNPFLHSSNLEEIYFRSFIPPLYNDTQFYENDCTHLTVYVPEETLELYKQSGWSQYAPYMVGYKYNDIGEWKPEYYISTDMSLDGKNIVLQQSSSGNGINLVLMGDGFSDRQIANGTYANVMCSAADAFFSEEPYKSFKENFNVSYVNVVSMTEGYEHTGQALGTGFGGGTYVYGNDNKVIEYAKKAIPENQMDDALIIVIMNQNTYAGTCFMYYPEVSGDYGRGLSIAYFPTNSDTNIFNGLISHEAGGHGFAKLADEYSYEYTGAIPIDVVSTVRSRETWGWYKNIDFTSDSTHVKWAQFIADSRYSAEKIGCYEGAYTYYIGAWRPTEDSIMRYNTGGFNAPSRYAIWYRINKLAYGDKWNGTYEDFVSYDAINRIPVAVQSRMSQSRHNCVENNLPPLTPPVLVGHSWREVK